MPLRRAEIIEFTLGRDVNDDDNDNKFTETRFAMGDPMHSRPAVAIYSGTEDAPVGTVYATTNDGLLQALDMNSGAELWSFIPTEMMRRLELAAAQSRDRQPQLRPRRRRAHLQVRRRR